MRRIPGRCYLCGDPAVDEWFCAAHLWASGKNVSKRADSIERFTRYHRYWIERFTPEQIVELAAWLP